MKSSQLIRLLKQHGWEIKSQKGSHIKFIHSQIKKILIVPNHGAAEMAKGTEKKILKDAGIKGEN